MTGELEGDRTGAAAGDEIVVVFAREPRPGLAKTRLAADVGVERAHELYEAFVLDTLDVARASGARVLVAHAPADAGPWFRERAPWAELWAQPDVKFGERLTATMEEAARRGSARTVMVGTDTPHLAPARLREALDALAGADVVLGPAADGGYFLVGLGRPCAALFSEIPWSTADTLRVTLDRCREEGLEVRLLPEEIDVDDGAGLEALMSLLDHERRAAPRTRGLLNGG